ncbi:Abi family protein [Oribacterium sp. Sow4_G1_1]|uniref:Abi family protein n=1 Tax=Oribacterium sp. Sow4_G1_1 TaxID=3438794 RepID=UPI003F9A9C4B
MSNKPKTINGLMKYLRDTKGLNISGSSQKRKLMNIGYYHGYKGYRYIDKPTNRAPFTEFDELIAVYDFDMQLKALFYPYVMQIETALKNYVLEAIVESIQSDSFSDVYSKLLDNYKDFSTTEKTYRTPRDRERAEDRFKKELQRRLDLRNRIYGVQANAFKNDNKIAHHFLSKDKPLPIWGIFELLSLGEFGHFVSCLNKPCREKISIKLGIQQSDDTNSMMPQRLIYTTKDLRNAIAHNDVVFDTRFKTGSIDKQISNAISNATSVSGITFDTITDYLVLLTYQLKLIGISKTELRRLIAGFSDAQEKLRSAIPASTYNQIIHTDNNRKIQALKAYIAK